VPGRLRYWDGQAWSEHVARANPAAAADKGAIGRDDLGAEPEWQDLVANADLRAGADFLQLP